MRRVIILALLVVGLVAGIFSFRQEIAIALQRSMMVSDWHAVHRVGAADNRQSGYIASFERHRDALTSLGYFERSEFPVRHIEPGTVAWKQLYLTLNEAATNVADAYFVMSGYDKQTPREVIVWARPGQRARFQAIISKFDVSTDTQPNTALEPTPTAP